MSDAMHIGRKVAMQRRKQQILGKAKQPVDTPAQPQVKVTPPHSQHNSTNITDEGHGDNMCPSEILPGGRANSMAYRLACSNGKSAQQSFKLKNTTSMTGVQVLSSDTSTRETAKKVRQERCINGKNSANPTNFNDLQQETQAIHTPACNKPESSAHMVDTSLINNNTPPQYHPTMVQQMDNIPPGNTLKVTGDNTKGDVLITGTNYTAKKQETTYTHRHNNTNRGDTTMNPTKNTHTRITISGNDRKSQSTTGHQNTPTKVMPSMTAMGNLTTGTQVGRVANVTGIDKGICHRVTGTGYQGNEESKDKCNTTAPMTTHQLKSSTTYKGQVITGNSSGGRDDITGCQSGICNTVTGTPYNAIEESTMCSASNQKEMKRRTSVMPQVTSISGTTTGPQGLTGAQKGACNTITGADYDDTNETKALCTDEEVLAGTHNRDFAPVADRKKITGDGWDKGDKVTGVGGVWASSRNASLRGNSAIPMGSSAYRPSKQLDVPESPITGSAGNTKQGARVTLSGGAKA